MNRDSSSSSREKRSRAQTEWNLLVVDQAADEMKERDEQKLAKLDASKSSCLHWIGHDAKGPVTGMVELLSRQNQPHVMMYTYLM